jgi:hypothetical protein
MSGTYTPDSSNNPLTFESIDDGDNKDVSSILPFLEGLADKAAHMDLPEQDSAQSYPIALQTIVRVQRNPWRSEVTGSPGSYSPTWLGLGVQTNQVELSSTSHSMYMDIEYMHGATLATLDVYVKGATGHPGLPSPIATARVIRYKLSDNTSTTLATQADTSADPTAYEARHTIAVVLNEVFDNSQYRYILQFDGEIAFADDANAVVGLSVYGAAAVGHTTVLDKGAS